MGTFFAKSQRYLADAAATRALGHSLAQRLVVCSGPSTLLLQGDLGAGKTSLVEGLARGLGIEEPISSPTYALAHHHRSLDGRSVLVHLDLYRLEQPGSADELFAQEAEEAHALGAVLAVEWPERLSRMPERSWVIQLAWADASDPAAGRLARILPPEDVP